MTVHGVRSQNAKQLRSHSQCRKLLNKTDTICPDSGYPHTMYADSDMLAETLLVVQTFRIDCGSSKNVKQRMVVA